MFSRLAIVAAVALSSGAIAAPKASDNGVVMVEAAETDDAAAVIGFLRQGVSVDATDGAGATALSFAMVNRNRPLVEALLKANANPNLVNDYGIGPLLIAIRDGDTDMVGRLLTLHADPNVAMWTGETPLMFASRIGDADMVRALIAAGADANRVETRYGQTALMWAAAAGHTEVVRLLLAAKASVTVATPAIDATDVYSNGLTTEKLMPRRRGGMTPLMFAVTSRNPDVVRLLLDAGADPNVRSADGTSPLLLSVYLHVNQQQTFPGDTSIVANIGATKLLLDRGADPNAACDGGLTPLAATAFLALGHDLRGTKSMGGIDIVEFNFQDDDAEAAVALLLAKGADPNKMVTDYLPTVPPGADLRRPTRLSNVSPLVVAAAFDKPALVRLMMESQRVDVKARSGNGDTPLMAAVRVNGLSAVKAFVAAGADVNATNKDGDTALHLAAISRVSGGGEIADVLLRHGARMDARNKTGKTPLDLAREPESKKGGNYGYGLPDPALIAAGLPVVLIYRGRPEEGAPALPGPTGRAYIRAWAQIAPSGGSVAAVH